MKNLISQYKKGEKIPLYILSNTINERSIIKTDIVINNISIDFIHIDSDNYISIADFTNCIVLIFKDNLLLCVFHVHDLKNIQETYNVFVAWGSKSIHVYNAWSHRYEHHLRD